MGEPRMKTQSFVYLVLIVGLILWNDVPAQAQIKIGVAAPLTGNIQWLGEQQEAGAQKAVDDLNDNGGLLGQEIEIISVDDGCDPNQAKAAAEQLVSQGVVFVDGHMCSSASLAVIKIYEAADIIMISPASTNPRVTDEGGPNVFRVTGRDDQQGAVAGTYLAETYPDAKIAIIHDGQAYGQGLAEHTKHTLNQKGVEEILFDAYVPDQLNYIAFADKLVESNIDVLYAGGYIADIALILRLAKKKLPNLQLLSGDAVASEDWLDLAGEEGVGTLFTFGPDIRLKPEAASIVAAFREEDAYEPAGYTLYSYAAVQTWAQAVQQAGSLNPTAVMKALHEGTFDTVLGKISFDQKGDVQGLSSYIWYIFETDRYVPLK